MNMTEVQTVLAVLGAAYWTGRAMPVETAKVYAQRLQDLEFDDAMSVVQRIIDTDTQGYFPTVGRIRDDYNKFRQQQALHQPLKQLSSGSKPDWLAGAPWFICLQAARQRDGASAGFPCDELRAGQDAELLAECERRGVKVDGFDWWKERILA